MTLGLVQYVLARDRLRPAIERIKAGKARVATGTPGVTAATRDGLAALGFTALEWKRIAAVVLFFVFAAIFWAAYEQAASTLNLLVNRYSDRNVLGFTIPAS